MTKPKHASKPAAPHVARRSTRGQRRLRFGQRDIVTHGLSNAVFQDLYHYFMTVGWGQVFLTFALFFLVFDILFGLAYAAVPGCIANLNPPGFPGAFFFSVETLATVGYGDMHPQTPYGHVVSMIEVFVGLMSIALITGIMFARFSVPRARFLFASTGVVRPIDGRVTLMFRVANARQNIIQEASAQLRLLRDTETLEGFRYRRIIDLPLLRSQHPLFTLGWNIMHVIDETSALFGETKESLEKSHSMFILTMSGTDETTGQVMMARHEYLGSEIRWNHAFRDIIEITEDGTVHFDYAKFHDIESLDAGPARRGSHP
jgi:inward rectifier potassium channel